MNGRQRRRAGSVNHDAGAFEVQAVGNAIGGDAKCPAGISIHIDSIAIAESRLYQRVVEARHAEEDADGSAGEFLQRLSAVLKRLERHFEDHALLHVHAGGFARRDAKEVSVELVEVLDEAAVLDVGFADFSRLRIVEGAQVPACRRHLDEGVNPIAQDLPVTLRSIGLARKTAANADDGYRFWAVLVAVC